VPTREAWSALLVREAVTPMTVAAALVVVISVAWYQRGSGPTVTAPEE
jgi:drug/metabolite transporter (DMT)-like permease